jgi:acyl-coenzyme A thioesterase PaaI-like protein
MTQARPRSLDVPEDATIPSRHPKAPGVGEPIPPHNPACRGCADVPGGLRIESWVDDDRGEGGEPGHGVAVRSRMLVTEDMQGGPGLIHGGFLTGAFDESLGQVPPLVTRACVTARLETDFRRPVPVGSTLWLRARLDGVVGRKHFVSGEARIDAEDGPLAGTARALFLQVGLEHFLRHSRPEDLEALGASPEQIRAARS